MLRYLVINYSFLYGTVLYVGLLALVRHELIKFLLAT